MKYRLVIFDFDGTLADSFPFFTSVFNQLAAKHGFKQIRPELVTELRHYSVRQMTSYVGLPAWKLPLVATEFIALMKQNAASITLFAGIDQVLRHLVDAGVTLAIVSSNSYDNVTQILGPENTKLISQFECGMSMFGKRSRIKKVLKHSDIAASEAIYIGDQDTDLKAARAASVKSGAVAWGYGAIEALRAWSPDEEFTSVEDLKRLVDRGGAKHDP